MLKAKDVTAFCETQTKEPNKTRVPGGAQARGMGVFDARR